MQPVTYYVPSEFQVMLNPDTLSVSLNCLRFCLETDGNILQLVIYDNEVKAIEPIPETICTRIFELKQEQQLTVAAVEQLLLPLKRSLIRTITQAHPTKLLNLSYILSSARGYLTKNGQFAAVFVDNALQLNLFDDIYSLCFTFPFNNREQALLITSEEHILREQEQVIFQFMVDGTSYKATTIAKKGQFHLQQIIKDTEIQHREILEKETPLPDIYRRFTTRKSRLILHK